MAYRSKWQMPTGSNVVSVQTVQTIADIIVQADQAGYERGVADERARIVAWLRELEELATKHPGRFSGCFDWLASELEAQNRTSEATAAADTVS